MERVLGLALSNTNPEVIYDVVFSMPENPLLPDTHFYEPTDIPESGIRLIKLDENTGYSTAEPHRHNYFEIFYFSSGSGTHLIDFKEYPVHSLSLHIIPPGVLHLIKRSKDSRGYVILFSRKFLMLLRDFTPSIHMRLWREKPVYPINLAENKFVKMSIEQIRDELSGDRPYQQKVLSSLLQMIFILLYRQAPAPLSNSLAERFFDLLEEHYCTYSILDFARALNCSPRTLSRSLKAADINSPLQCILNRKILEAKRMLAHTNSSIKEIAYQLNFSDPDYFGKVFKSSEHLSPGEFRLKNRK